MKMSYPKVLIVGQQFNKQSGAGITLTNLFYGWDKNNIAVAATDIYNPDFSVCDKYYLIGDREIERGFPFNLKFSEEHQKSNIVQKSSVQNDLYLQKQTVSKLGKIKDQLLFFTGQIHRRRKFILSKEFLIWINEFSPDIIYSQLSNLELIHFISNLKEYFNKPVVIHIMDDWPKTISNRQKGLFHSYWDRRIDKELRKLFDKTEVLLSISEAMSEEYLKRYGKIFLPFHNPIDVKNWTSSIKEYSRKDTFIVLYAGRIGTGLQNCLLSFAYAVKNQVNKGRKIEFHIQSGSDNPVLKELDKFECVKFRKRVPYGQLPDIFSAVDLLLLPNDFDEKSVSFLRYSMPTKASEYMVSGTPILVFSSSETAITKNAIKYNWAYVVSENSVEKIESAISILYEDDNLRRNLGCRAKEFAIMHFESEKIRENFKNSIMNSR